MYADLYEAMSDLTDPKGICQDINAYAVSLNVAPPHPSSTNTLAAPSNGQLPLAFQGIDRWDQKKVVSPYASGFAVEALFERGHGALAVELVERVWGVMAHESSPGMHEFQSALRVRGNFISQCGRAMLIILDADYSGGHWEAMKPDGAPITDDTSLMHGWSTWPVFLLPRYLGGLQPLQPGWTRWKVQPVLADMDWVNLELSTPAGKIGLKLRMFVSTGELIVKVPIGSTAEVFPPKGWILVTTEEISKVRPVACQIITGQGVEVVVKICKVNG